MADSSRLSVFPEHCKIILNIIDLSLYCPHLVSQILVALLLTSAYISPCTPFLLTLNLCSHSHSRLEQLFFFYLVFIRRFTLFSLILFFSFHTHLPVNFLGRQICINFVFQTNTHICTYSYTCIYTQESQCMCPCIRELSVCISFCIHTPIDR